MSEEEIFDSEFIASHTPRKQGETSDTSTRDTFGDVLVHENSAKTINSQSQLGANEFNSAVISSQRSITSLSVWSQDIGNYYHSRDNNHDNTSDDEVSVPVKPPSFNYHISGEAVAPDTDNFADIDNMLILEEEAAFTDDQSKAVVTHTSSIRTDQSPAHASRRKSTRLSLVKAVESRNSLAKKALEELTINKLKITSLGLVGRDLEKSMLKECYQRLCKSSGHTSDSQKTTTIVPNELVFIQGYSGIGKSVLARTIQEVDFGTNSNTVYVEGKYEFTSTDEPYSGLSQVFGKLCLEFHDCPSDIRERISSAIKENMKEEAHMLMGTIPEISAFLTTDDSAATSVRVDSFGGREHERLKYAFRTFTRILGSHFSPIIIFLDDLQWADVSSIDVMDYLISDVQNPHPLMIIGCYRSNEVDENSILYNRIQTLEGKHRKGIFQLTDIKLENCNVESVNKIIMAMMSIDNEFETRELAEVCFKRTLGNPFFLIEFMIMLQTEGLLEFNIGVLKWIWDVERIENRTMSAANVVDLLQARMKTMPNDVQLLLQYAACLGASFSVKILKHIWSQHACPRLVLDATDDFDDMLEMIKEVRLVEPCGSDDDLRLVHDMEHTGLGELRWVHDRVQEAALSLSDLVTPEFQSEIGMFLFRGLGKAQLEQKLFDVADLVNKGNETNRVDIALMNFQAATKARNMAALSSAAKYAQFGMKQLGAEKWTLHRALTLQLYSLGAEIEHALGHIDKAEWYIEIVLARDEYTPLEKFPLKKMNAQILSRAYHRWDEAIDYGLAVLKELGFKFLWNRKLNPVQMLVAVRKTAKRLKKVDLEDIGCLDFIEDENMLAVIDMLLLLGKLSYSAKDLPLSFLCSCKVIELTLDNGIALCSGTCFSIIGGVVMFLFKDHAAASHVCDLAFALQKRSGRNFIADTIHCAWAFVYVHIKPLHEGLNLLTDGYSQGLRDGDPDTATTCLVNRFVRVPYMMGRSLDSVIKEFPKIAPSLEESGIKNNILTLRVWWQMMVNLTLSPSDESSKKLEGDQFRQSEEKAESNMYIGNINFAIGELLLFFGDYEGRVERLIGGEKGKTYSELVVGYPPHSIETFHRGIVWFEMAQKTGKRAYKSRAMKIKKEISKWVEKGNPNAKDYDMLLSAEQAVLKKKYKKADEFYKKAIVHAARIGHLAHAALYNERFGKYLLDVHGNMDDCAYHMEEAIRYYREWGAIGKADQLQTM